MCYSDTNILVFIPPLIDDKVTYILVMQFSVATDGAVHTGLVLLFKPCLDSSKLKYCDLYNIVIKMSYLSTFPLPGNAN